MVIMEIPVGSLSRVSGASEGTASGVVSVSGTCVGSAGVSGTVGVSVGSAGVSVGASGVVSVSGTCVGSASGVVSPPSS